MAAAQGSGRRAGAYLGSPPILTVGNSYSSGLAKFDAGSGSAPGCPQSPRDHSRSSSTSCGWRLRLIALLQHVRHDPLELRAERPLVTLGQAFQLLDQIGPVERRDTACRAATPLGRDAFREILLVKRRTPNGPAPLSHPNLVSHPRAPRRACRLAQSPFSNMHLEHGWRHDVELAVELLPSGSQAHQQAPEVEQASPPPHPPRPVPPSRKPEGRWRHIVQRSPGSLRAEP